MACFTKTQQRNGTNCEFEKYVGTSNIFVLNSLAKSHLDSVCTKYECDKSENARVCAKWQWNALDWCYWIALPASPVLQSSNTVSCVSLPFRTHPCAIMKHQSSAFMREIYRCQVDYPRKGPVDSVISSWDGKTRCSVKAVWVSIIYIHIYSQLSCFTLADYLRFCKGG